MQLLEHPCIAHKDLRSRRSQLTLFCDLDGPLIDVSQRYYQTYQTALTQLQGQYRNRGCSLLLTPLSARQFWEMKQARIPDIEIARQSGLQNKQIDDFLQHVRAIVNHPQVLGQDRVQPGVREALARLHRWGVQLAVVTLRSHAQAIQILHQYDLAHWFSHIQGAQDHLAAYDNYAEHKQALLAKTMSQPEFSNQNERWMIGDTEADILAAQALGMSCIAVTCGMRSHDYLQQLQPTSIHGSFAIATSFLLGVEAA
ncbi:5'-nucleotidase [Acaryochloris thomasi RCC1774]|uniref:5'-nucleotidase n=1 Tax=Acaryochloris thomasi RCC1774 TaxID=1764569 RepID=A0A2W1JH07_9CYAN|nr:HAD family hydrolase [Acaryochloris thomasi]PZD72808.1 5'-nucleotidase [Acaryochloris thomasi RCC1774]